MHLDPNGRLIWDMGGAREEVWPVRCFPLSDPFGPVSMCALDGREVAMIERLDRLAPDVRVFLEQELRRREFVPVIAKVLSISPASEPNIWEVLTDRGRTSFELQADGDVRRVGEHGLLIVDAHGLRYSVPDIRRLDRKSRRLLVRYR